MHESMIQLFEKAMLDSGRGRRFTQDSPILPDVWLAYAKQPEARIDLLLTPHWGNDAGAVAIALARRVRKERAGSVWTDVWPSQETGTPRIAYTNSTVAAALRFDELLRAVVPMTEWWDRFGKKVAAEAGGVAEAMEHPETREDLPHAMIDMELLRTASAAAAADLPYVEPDLIWMVRLVGLIAVSLKENGEEIVCDFLEKPTRQEPESGARMDRRLEAARAMFDATAELVDGMDVDDGLDPMVWSVNLNRPAEASVFESSLAVKADAARRLFDIDCSELTWAVIDSGIDATHPAFARRDEQLPGRPPIARSKSQGGFRYKTRVKATYDFSLVRYLLSPDTDALDERIAELRLQVVEDARSPRASARLSELISLQRLRQLLVPDSPDLGRRIGVLKRKLKGVDDDPRPTIKLHRHELRQLEKARRQIKEVDGGGDGTSREEKAQALRRGLDRGRSLDWRQIEDFLRIDHDESYRVPQHNHGTHVAGILGGEWWQADEDEAAGNVDLVGVAPDIGLYDLRVLGDDGTGDEFSVIAALQFVRFLNDHSDAVVVHGTNLSVSIHHAVSNYACGRTPVCEESERLASSGVVVVAAAGNRGYVKLRTYDNRLSEGYAAISITDPGNTEAVITVGATHRSSPHAYGVSYFSSRGPTGDGRRKPDLVAPGEKITAPIPGRKWAVLDGTSMAAPHASGVAALLIARHRELAGQPARIKEILCATATDLGRERYFQGAGMIDALRALQAV